MNLHGETLKWILHVSAAASPIPAFKGLVIRDYFQKKQQVPTQSPPSRLQNQTTPGSQQCKVLTEL